MGQIKIKIIIKNYEDLINKIKNPGQIEIDAIVNSGARMAAIPNDMSEYLGLEIVEKRTIGYANGSTELKNIGSLVHIEIPSLKRQTDCKVLIENPGAPVLLGQIPMEDMDVIIDMSNEILTVNPESPYMPMSHQY